MFSTVRESLEEPLLGLKIMGSFGCIVVRFANANFAQDDKI
jgi:hypothetical protein